MIQFQHDYDPPMHMAYGQRIMTFFLIAFICMVIGGGAVALIMGRGLSTMTLRIATVVQDLIMFIIPAVATAVMVSKLPARLLCVDRMFNLRQLSVAILIMVVSIPAMNYIVQWNESLVLPDAMSSMEKWMRESETSVRQSVEMLLGGTSPGDLVVSLLIVAVLAALSEELFFRGTLQRLLGSGKMNHHVVIWLTACIFSVFHMQFFGFVPRLLLGAYFGYLLYWTESLWLPVAIHALNNGIVVWSSWHMRCGEGYDMFDVNNIGSGNIWIVISSFVLTTVLMVVLNHARFFQNSVR